jgi:sialic acid synthase SpsE
MSTIILDFGSGNTSKNDKSYIKRMYDELKTVDTGKREIIVKWQLFENWYGNVPLSHESFDYAYDYGKSLGYKVTSSVFDKESLNFLLGFDPCFVKIANRKNLYWLIGQIPRKITVIASCNNINQVFDFEENVIPMVCVSEYPALIEKYDEIPNIACTRAISDHTTNWDLFNKYQPDILEIHYKLEDSVGLDAGDFARTPAILSEIL